MKILVVVILVFGALLSGCSSLLQPGLNERDLYVVNTPEYQENRVFLLPTSTDEIKTLMSLYEASNQPVTTDQALKHGHPLTIVVNGVRIPRQPDEGTAKTRDIAVVLDIYSSADASGQSIVVWYQRGVPPDQTLNFANLLIHHESAWEERVAPLFRMRIMDVSAEKNIESRAALAEIQKYSGVLGAALANPAINPIINIASKAAGLVLAGKDNRMLLDYTIQFYSPKQVQASQGGQLPALRKGRFLLLGRPKNSTSAYWTQDFKFEEKTARVIESKGSMEADSPYVLVTVSGADVVVPAIVAARSAYLQKLISNTTQLNLDRLQQEGDALQKSLHVYVVVERAKRFRRYADIKAVYDEAAKADAASYSAEDRAYLFRTFEQFTSCPYAKASELVDWWTANGKDAKFKSGELVFDGHETCKTT